MSFLRNTWYVAAWAQELTDAKPLSRRILGDPVVFYRDRIGRPAALIDRCAHRFAPLSLGKVIDDCIQCPYHGLRFDASGACVHNPHGHGRIPARAAIRAYPLAERYGAIWIWMGEPERASEETIPVFEFMDSEESYVGSGAMRVEGNYQLESDNILDLSHIEFVHPLFSSRAVSKGSVSHEIAGNTVWSKREILDDETPPEFIRQNFNVREGPIDRWLHVHWQAPSCMALYAGGVASGQPREQGIVSRQAHWFTPETDRSTHYFYAVTRPRSAGPEAEALVQEDAKALYIPFRMEDAPIIEAQQRNMGDRTFEEMQPLILNVDAAGTAARRILARMIAEEKESPRS